MRWSFLKVMSLFGTDGVRGTPGVEPLDGQTLQRFGAAIAWAVEDGRRPTRVLIGRDTRESGPWIIEQLGRGFSHAGVEAFDGGVLPTPAVAGLTRDGDYHAGIVISASHNPYQDNGVKVIAGTGEKADDALESRISARVADPGWQVTDDATPVVAPVDVSDGYATQLTEAFAALSSAAPLSLAFDCANGATSTVAPAVWRRLGFEPIVIHDRPDGRNINLDCGSTHPDALSRTVREHGCRLGAAFDGDGDRVLFVDHQGAVINGDAVLLIAARRLARSGQLPGNAIVATVMSNLGLERALAADGVTVHRCPVGDRSVWIEMQRRGAALGGEQSGHIIQSGLLPTGDGLATALMIVTAVVESGRELADLAADLVPLPQVLVNARVGRRVPLEELPGVSRAIAAAEGELRGTGRVLVRYSGTEALLRVMVEGAEQATIERLAEGIASRAVAELGAG